MAEKPNNSFFDYNADAGIRLWDLMETRNLTYRNQLKQSAKTAGAQLELMKPSLMGGSAGSFYAGPAVLSPSGTVLIVLAHGERAFTMHSVPVAGCKFGDGIEQGVNYIKELDDGKEYPPGAVAVVIESLIKEYGRAPGQKGEQFSQEHALRVIGALFMGVLERVDLAARIRAGQRQRYLSGHGRAYRQGDRDRLMRSMAARVGPRALCRHGRQGITCTSGGAKRMTSEMAWRERWRRQEAASTKLHIAATNSEIIEATAEYLIAHGSPRRPYWLHLSILNMSSGRPVSYEWRYKNAWGISTTDEDRARIWIESV